MRSDKKTRPGFPRPVMKLTSNTKKSRRRAFAREYLSIYFYPSPTSFDQWHSEPSFRCQDFPPHESPRGAEAAVFYGMVGIPKVDIVFLPVYCWCHQLHIGLQRQKAALGKLFTKFNLHVGMNYVVMMYKKYVD
jgi:hypothetical protein